MTTSCLPSGENINSLPFHRILAALMASRKKSMTHTNLKTGFLTFCLFLSSFSFGQMKDKAELRKVSKEILTLVKDHSIVVDSINWTAFNLEIETEINRIQNMDSSDFVISKIIKQLRKYGDHHSVYSNKARSEQILSHKTSVLFPTSKLVANGIGYLHLPFHLSMNKDENYRYADTLRKQIQYLDVNNHIKGWIVDLRDNYGGNMWPMLAGLNPLLEDNTVGYQVISNHYSSWESNSKKPFGLPKMRNTYKCKDLKNKIAVLIDTVTASSGEMIAISLLGMGNSKSFGNPTGGYTTTNGTYRLSNGAYLFLANGYCADRNKKVYMGKIQPDVAVDNSEAMQAAMKWIENK
jgi:carboxyl-terminal processing protease